MFLLNSYNTKSLTCTSLFEIKFQFQIKYTLQSNIIISTFIHSVRRKQSFKFRNISEQTIFTFKDLIYFVLPH